MTSRYQEKSYHINLIAALRRSVRTVRHCGVPTYLGSTQDRFLSWVSESGSQPNHSSGAPRFSRWSRWIPVISHGVDVEDLVQSVELPFLKTMKTGRSNYKNPTCRTKSLGTTKPVQWGMDPTFWAARKRPRHPPTPAFGRVLWILTKQHEQDVTRWKAPPRRIPATLGFSTINLCVCSRSRLCRT